MMGVIAQMGRELKAERTAAGRAAAKARGTNWLISTNRPQ